MLQHSLKQFKINQSNGWQRIMLTHSSKLATELHLCQPTNEFDSLLPVRPYFSLGTCPTTLKSFSAKAWILSSIPPLLLSVCNNTLWPLLPTVCHICPQLKTKEKNNNHGLNGCVNTGLPSQSLTQAASSHQPFYFSVWHLPYWSNLTIANTNTDWPLQRRENLLCFPASD